MMLLGSAQWLITDLHNGNFHGTAICKFHLSDLDLKVKKRTYFDFLRTCFPLSVVWLCFFSMLLLWIYRTEHFRCPS
eukprot:UN24972